jgi:cobalt/nickel transport system permease protein
MKLDIDEYAHLRSPLHRWQPRYKLIGLGMLMFAVAMVESLWLLPVVAVMTAGLYCLSTIPVSYWCQRLRYPGYFLLGVVLVLPWMAGDTVIWQWGLLTLRQEGCWAVVLISVRFLSIITLSLLLFGTSPFLHTVKAMRSLGLSPVLTDMLLLSYRYLYETADQLQRMRQAMRLRGFGYGRGRSIPFIPRRRDLQVLAALAGTLLIRSYEQSERVYQAMRLRGYGSATQRAVEVEGVPLDGWTAIATGVSVVMAIALGVANYWMVNKA